MAIAFRAAANAASLTVNKPTGTANGDILVAHVIDEGNHTITPPSGWTQIDNIGVASNSIRAASFWKLAGGSEPSTYTWTIGSATYTEICVAAYSGCDTTTPINTHTTASDPNSPTLAVPSVTTTVDNCMLSTACNEWFGKDWSSGAPTNYTLDSGLSTSTGFDLGSFHRAVTTAGAYSGGTPGWNNGNGGNFKSITVVALQPPSGTTTQKTLTSTARITAQTQKTLTSTARITKTGVQKTLTSTARITVSTQKTLTSVARITAQTQRTLTSTARITASTQKTLSSTARITATTQKTLGSTARITAQTQKTLSSVARITATTQKTLTSTAKIVAAGQTQRTLTSTARITKTGVQQTLTSTARLQRTATQQLSSTARITRITQRTLTSTARITATTLKTLSSTARVQVATSKTLTSVARLQRITQRTLSSTARIAAAGAALPEPICSAADLGAVPIAQAASLVDVPICHAAALGAAPVAGLAAKG